MSEEYIKTRRTIEYDALPNIIHTQVEESFVALMDPDREVNFLYGSYKDASRDDVIEYNEDDFWVEPVTIPNQNEEDKQYVVVKCHLPEPPENKLAKRIYIFFETNFKESYYFIVEKNETGLSLVEILNDEEYRLYGTINVSEEEENEFVIDAFMDFYVTGSGDLAELSLDELQEREKQGDKRAAKELAKTYDAGIQGFIKRAAEGDVESMLYLADIYNKGLYNAEVNYEKAAMYYQMAASHGEPRAIFMIGLYHYEGNYFERNEKKSIEYVKKAADVGYPEAQELYGMFCDGGKAGGLFKKKEACKYYGLAAKNGLAKSQVVYGHYKNHGIGCIANEKEAIFWFCCAYIQGDNTAMDNLNKYLAAHRITNKEVKDIMRNIKTNYPQYVPKKVR